MGVRATPARTKLQAAAETANPEPYALALLGS